MAFIWKGLCSAAKATWNVAAPVLKQAAGDVLGGLFGNSPDVPALTAEKTRIDEEKSAIANKIKQIQEDYDKKQKEMAEKERALQSKQNKMLQEQENLKRAEKQLVKVDSQTSEYAEKQELIRLEQERLYEKVLKFEKNQLMLVEKKEEEMEIFENHRQRLEENYKVLQDNQLQIINLIKILPAVEKVKELQAFTDTIKHNCKVHDEDPDAMVDKARQIQFNYNQKLMEVRNVMLEGHFFPGVMKVWAQAVVLDLHMLGFLVSKGIYINKTVDSAKKLYLGYWNDIKMAHSTHMKLPGSAKQLREIEDSLESQFDDFDHLMERSMPSKVSPLALGPPQDDDFHSSSNRYAARRQENPYPQFVSGGRELARRRDGGEDYFPHSTGGGREPARRRDGGENHYPHSAGGGRELARRRDEEEDYYPHSASGGREPARRRDGGENHYPHSASGGRELARRRDESRALEDEERLLHLERQLAAMKMNKNRRPEGPSNDDDYDDFDARYSSRSPADYPPRSRSVQYPESGRDPVRRSKQGSSHDHRERAENSSQDYEVNRGDRPQHGRPSGNGSRSQMSQKEQKRYRASPTRENYSEESSSSSADEQFSENLPKKSSHYSKGNREIEGKPSRKRY